jgi:hypothetical protein
MNKEKLIGAVCIIAYFIIAFIVMGFVNETASPQPNNPVGTISLAFMAGMLWPITLIIFLIVFLLRLGGNLAGVIG